MQTENKPLIFAKMADILQDIDAIAKNHTNAQQGFKFRGIDDVYNAVNPLFKKHRIFMTSKIIERSREERPSKSGGINIWTLLLIEWSYFAEDGTFVTSIAQGEAMDSGDKGSNKAMSVSQKYSIIQTFAIPLLDGNPDPDKGKEGSAEEVEKLKRECDLHTESKRLAEWCNEQTDYHGNKELVEYFKKKIKSLKSQGL